MKAFVGKGLGRVVVLSFERGEDLLEGVRTKLGELGIKDAVLVSAIGTLEKAVFHRVTSLAEKPDNEFITIDGPIELSAVDGAVVDGEPHLHMVFSDLDKTYSGHLEDDCIVLYLAELIFVELEGLELRRVQKGYVKLLEERS